MPVQSISNNFEPTVIQSHGEMRVRYLVADNNSTVAVSLHSTAGRLVWSGTQHVVGKGYNQAICPTGNLCPGIYILSLAVNDAGGCPPLARTIVIANR
jgi:hypothetical protein